jgi:glycosyltransferase involved in cell wall biosynthesis
MPSDRLNAVILHVALDPITGAWSVMRDLALAQAASGRYAAVGIGVIASRAWPDLYASEFAKFALPTYRAKTLKIFGTAQFLWQRMQRPPVDEWVRDLMKVSGASQAIVHFHNAWMSGVFLPLDTGVHGIVRVVATMHGCFANFNRKPLRHCLHRWMASRLTRHHAHLTSVDRAGTIQAERLLGIRRDRFTVIPNGVADDQNLRANQWTGQGVFRLGYLGHLEERKGWRIGAQAALELTAQGKQICYIIAGEGPEKEQAKALQRRHPSVIEYLGHVSQPRKIFLPNLHALSLMSSNEGLPMSILEALSIGLPVIATPAGGIPEAVKDDLSGFLVSRDSESLARAIVRLYDHPKHHVRLGSEGKRIFLKTFELSHVIQQYHNLYLGNLREPHNPSVSHIHELKRRRAALCD